MLIVILFLVTTSFVICKCMTVLKVIWKRSLKVANHPLSGLEIVRNVVHDSVYSVETCFMVKVNIVVDVMMKCSESLAV